MTVDLALLVRAKALAETVQNGGSQKFGFELWDEARRLNLDLLLAVAPLLARKVEVTGEAL